MRFTQFVSLGLADVRQHWHNKLYGDSSEQILDQAKRRRYSGLQDIQMVIGSWCKFSDIFLHVKHSSLKWGATKIGQSIIETLISSEWSLLQRSGPSQERHRRTQSFFQRWASRIFVCMLLIPMSAWRWWKSSVRVSSCEITLKRGSRVKASSQRNMLKR